ncbi:NAD-dependent succinate-semialdehyde dehydrogenase [Geminocystis sp. NIES-3709]|uniref:NAD-dependent succinate-semialdehyde dehydrogenase n=1 Tax=Geminocystis sp. NIES-3709 TaxID=1617448 RepID=UPI0005FCD374|nr:NAD-dependent succinate-semialdehyde dehydrogenase [Geminocystis sp. NIES-3709]BAQ66305.1 succinate-semialdehyde dehydrogenase [Geminocystis sp. NIES-3709]
MTIATINPFNGETLQIFTPLTSEEINQKLALAVSTFQDYRLTSLEFRGERLLKTAEILEVNREKYAKLMTIEMGKPIKQAVAEINKCAVVCRFYAENAQKFLTPKYIDTDASESFVTYQPLGAILAVMPWNFPFWQVFRFLSPALMAGNVGLLKHASNVPQCALAIESVLLSAGFPEGVFQTLLIESPQVEKVLRDSRVKAVTLTGSELAGKSVASIAGQELKKSVLELGGSDPFIVLDDANIEEATEVAVTARMLNNGQTCIAAKRFILHNSIADEFEKLLVEKYHNLILGDPLEPNTDIGPLATPNILKDITHQVSKTIEMGGKVLIGGQTIENKGNFYPPTILTNIPVNSPGMIEEFFGPVALLFRVNNLQEAIELANSTIFGLGASIWTKNEENIKIAVRDIEVGALFINGLVKSDPRLPFGGTKSSGYGRELSMEGMHEFVNIKTVWQK